MEKVRCCSCLLRTFKTARGMNSSRLPMNVSRRMISFSQHLQYAKTGFGKGIAARVQVSVDEGTLEYLEENKLKYREHPGVFHMPKVELPEKFRDAVQQIVSHENLKHILENGKYLRNYMWKKCLPIEEERYRDKVSQIESRLEMRDQAMLPFLSEEETAKLEQRRENEILRRLRKTVYHWEPIRFNKSMALAYIFGRSAGEYAALCRIFSEISKRNPEFKPTTLCDFGSGIGTVSWAARQFWSSSLLEHLCADVSSEMHDLAELILRGGSKNDDHPIPALFLRSHLPESYRIRYDLVVSAFSLMELPSTRARLETIDKLWNKTEQYLVIVESGTKAGFTIIQEVRDYLLRLGSKTKKPTKCHVVSPCPHNVECPRAKFDTIPCNFRIKFRPVYPFHQSGCENDLFSYVVIRRGYEDPNEEKWPRLVEEPMIRPRHVICRLCTKEGKLQETVLTKAKHSQPFRLLAKRSTWGDLLPIHIDDKPPAEETEVTNTTENYDRVKVK